MMPVPRRRVLTYFYNGFIALAVGCRDKEDPAKGQDKRSTFIPRYGGLYRKRLGLEPFTLDPVFITDIYAALVAQQVFDGLVQFDANLNVVPCIAKSWKASYDGLVWTFDLRQGVKFHHGREVSADAFVYT